MHVGRLIRSGDYDARSFVSLKIARDGRNFLKFGGCLPCTTESGTQRGGELFDFRGAKNDAMGSESKY